MPSLIAKIAVSDIAFHVDKPYEYIVPEELEKYAIIGKRVLVPFGRGNHLKEGIILELYNNYLDGLKYISRIIDSEPILIEKQIKLALFMHDRYFCTVYEAVKSMLPTGLWLKDDGSLRVKDKFIDIAKLAIDKENIPYVIENYLKKAKQQANILKEMSYCDDISLSELLSLTGASKASFNKLCENGFCSIEKKEVYRIRDFRSVDIQNLPLLNEEQSAVFNSLVEIANENKPSTTLLQGVTGSGKTSIYIHIINYIISLGRTAILLVPEISLTPQMIHTFTSYFGDDICILHSALSSSERFDEWKKAKNNKAHLVIGTRSAVFAPVDNIGLIIIDEEQEDSYKSENCPRYNAEEIAKYRCYKDNSILILGSATPKITSRYYAEIGKYNFLRLDKRYNICNLPDVTVVDLKEELKSGNPYTISNFLRDEIAINIESKEQSILFLNRRGARKLVTCTNCGFVYKCANCSVPLTYHSTNGILMCHYCGYKLKVDSYCPECKEVLKFIGVGTQLVEKEIHDIFPNIEVIRMDADSLNANNSHEKVFSNFVDKNIPIMVGTQMVSKGLNFNNVTLVGVILADFSLYTGDYRAAEKTFSLLCQVVGRAGRGNKPGRAVIQTYTPNNETIIQAAHQDYDAFYSSEITIRKFADLPPFSDIVSFTVIGQIESNVINAANYIKLRLSYIFKDYSNIEVLGPSPYIVVKVNNSFRYRVILKCNINNKIRNIISSFLIEINKNKDIKGLNIYADINPLY